MASTISAGTTAGSAIVVSGDTSGSLALQTNGTTTAVTIDTSQNVGIGTASPDGKLDIATGGSTDIVAALGGTFPAYTYRNGSGAWFHAGKHPSSDYFYIGNGGTPTTNISMVVDPSGNLLFNSGYGSAATAYGCRAWVNFNGTGTVAIRASGNVSSITDNGTGDYTVNFTTAMTDANYALNGTYSWVNGVSAGGGLTIRNEAGYIPTTTTCRVICQGQNGTNYDRDYVFVSIFR